MNNVITTPELFRAVNSSIWQRALPRSRPCRASHRHEPNPSRPVHIIVGFAAGGLSGAG
jgi:hypothetical protein